VTAYLVTTATPVCLGRGCGEVIASPFGRLLGLPVAGWGLALYLSIGAAALAGARHAASRPGLVPVVLGLAVFGAAFSAYLLWVQVAVIRAVCLWCVASDGLWALLLLSSISIIRGGA
jgi:uncharacterized membrane protein